MTAVMLPQPLDFYRDAPRPEPVAQVDVTPRDLRAGDVLMLTTGSATVNAISPGASGAWRITAVRAGHDPSNPESWITLTPGPVDRLTVLRRANVPVLPVRRSCPVCGRTRTVTALRVMPKHGDLAGRPCAGAGRSPDEGLGVPA